VLAVGGAVGIGVWFWLAYDPEAHKFSNELALKRAREIVARVLPDERQVVQPPPGEGPAVL